MQSALPDGYALKAPQKRPLVPQKRPFPPRTLALESPGDGPVT